MSVEIHCGAHRLETFDSRGLLIMIIVESAGIKDVGRRRKSNEDAFLIDDDLKLYVVADGMGGHQAGEVASRLAVQTIHDYMKRFGQEGEVEELADSDRALSKEANRLISSITLANWGVNQLSQSNEAYRGMGSTVSAIHFAGGDIAIAANVGDSPIYLIHNGKIETLSVPHTVRAEREALFPGTGNPLDDEYSHMLTRAVGVGQEVKADACEISCFRGDTLVMSSDGLSDLVSPDEILRVVVREQSSERACRALVDLANERGGHDNTTVLVVTVKAVLRERKGILGLALRLISKFSGLSPKIMLS